jgi:hypothetical protein
MNIDDPFHDVSPCRKYTYAEFKKQAIKTSLLAMLDEERLRYIGSVVLGLNDALVELTGALAGLTFALRLFMGVEV